MTIGACSPLAGRPRRLGCGPHRGHRLAQARLDHAGLIAD